MGRVPGATLVVVAEDRCRAVVVAAEDEYRAVAKEVRPRAVLPKDVFPVLTPAVPTTEVAAVASLTALGSAQAGSAEVAVITAMGEAGVGNRGGDVRGW